jgi:hypothetical protein
LDQALRGELVTCIVEEFYSNSYAMGVHEFQCITKKIVQLFPNEDADIYFFPAIKKLNQTRPSGKLPTKYYNFIRKISLMIRQQTTDVFNELG